MVALLYSTDPAHDYYPDFVSFYELLLLYKELEKTPLEMPNVIFTYVNLEEDDDEKVKLKKLSYFKSIDG